MSRYLFVGWDPYEEGMPTRSGYLSPRKRVGYGLRLTLAARGIPGSGFYPEVRVLGLNHPYDQLSSMALFAAFKVGTLQGYGSPLY